MTYTGLSYGTGLAASATAEGIHSSFSGTIGTPVAIGTYPGTQPDIAYSLRLEISAGETLEWNPLTGAVTGGDAGANQVETATVVAASGVAGLGSINVVVTAAGVTGSPVTVAVALTNLFHTTAPLIATAIRDAMIGNAAIAAKFTPTSSGATVILTALNKLANDATLNISIPSGLGITAAPTSANTTAGVRPTAAYRKTGTAWTPVDQEGFALPTATKIYGVLLACDTSNGALVAMDSGSYASAEPAPFRISRILPNGNSGAQWGTDTVSFSADLPVEIYLDIHAGT